MIIIAKMRRLVRLYIIYVMYPRNECILKEGVEVVVPAHVSSVLEVEDLIQIQFNISKSMFKFR